MKARAAWLARPDVDISVNTVAIISAVMDQCSKLPAKV